MNKIQERVFSGFSKKTVTFLKNLKKNNNKVWFEQNRGKYQDHLLEPLKDLVTDLGLPMLTIDPSFEIRPAVNKTISRIHRDTRFSKDKSPYRSCMWITFKRPIKGWQEAPAYFFELSIDSYRYGMGFFCASKTTMDKFRRGVDTNPKKFLKAISFYKKGRFTLEGEKYKRVLDKTKPEAIQEWYQR